MSEDVLVFIGLSAPISFLLVALYSWFEPGIKPLKTIFFAQIASIISMLAALICAFGVYQYGYFTSETLGINELGLSIRFDALSVLMMNMIAILSFFIIKFSINYLDGDAKHGAFIGRLAATFATVFLLVTAGNLGLLFLAWVMASVTLHRLLIFYPERITAQNAAKKKFILARLGDACLLIAILLLYKAFGSGDFQLIFESIQSGAFMISWQIEVAALFLALAAVLKSAQFPTHGWLVEVMETPTPVSALLHAGLLNAGPFLIIRMAYVLDVSTVAPLFLIFLGGFTAIFASIAYMTQTSVKTALGYSSVGHMGFSLMLGGLGVYAAGMLHLVAHSFYKAHAFLSTGSVIDRVKIARVGKLPKKVKLWKVLLGLCLAILMYTGFALLWGIEFDKELSLLLVGAVISLGLTRILTDAISTAWNPKLILQAIILASVVSLAFFSLESAMHHIIASQIPFLTTPSQAKLYLFGFILFFSIIAVIIQMIAPTLKSNPKYKAFAIHFRNGFYANALFDKLIGALDLNNSKSTKA
ncbi:proton-conducting transporter transmembrane domain-containing protein [Penaeicola halotolerans]|uniref:proton-conducting transporter transmembrane domain-containing protein n=1 Tax=Penaeicola halotolerans TaxID=2793196 RepID=UPI001CF87D0F|nr:proton-conducting transporter membrane subunit [Penaeicola halotolerans]